MSKLVLRKASLLVCLIIQEILLKSIRKKRRYWVQKIYAQRYAYGATATLCDDLCDVQFKKFHRMDKPHFEYLLRRVSPLIEKKHTPFRETFSCRMKLQITLRYLATGDSFQSLQYFFRVSESSISLFLPDVCNAIYEVLKEFIQIPRTEEDWHKIREGFRLKWNFPICVEAMDGKHIDIRAPAHCGSSYFNYKKKNSIILLACVDHDYCFLYIDVGAHGRDSDGGVYDHSPLKTAIENNSLNLPEGSVFVADAAFPLTIYLMKPYPGNDLPVGQKIYNYRLSRARRIVENAFGILASKFQIFGKNINLKISTTIKVTKACCALHKWLRKTQPGYFTPGLVDVEDINTGSNIEGSWRQNSNVFTSFINENNISTEQAKAKRDALCTFFNSPDGSVPWQFNCIH